LRVLFVTPGFVRERDEPGMPAVVDLIERVAEIHEVRVVSLRHPQREPPYRVAGALVHALGIARQRGVLGRARVLAGGVGAVLRLHRRSRVDLLHGLWADESGAAAAIAGRLIRRPVVVSVLGGELVGLANIGYGAALGRGGRWTTAISLRLANLVVVGSSVNAALVAGRGRRANTGLVPLGVDRARFGPGEPRDAGAGEPGGQTVLFVGSLEPVKDPALLVRAFARVAADRPGARLAIAGEGSLGAELVDLVRRLGVERNVAFLGRVPRDQLPDVYRSSTVLAVPSRHEGQSIVAVEAAASALPIVGTATGVLPDLGAGAITVARGDEAALAGALASVLDDPALARRTGDAALAAAVRFDIERTVEALLARYEALAGPLGPGG
jgi:glycosyltransferase involved in cell wall biosynthesis